MRSLIAIFILLCALLPAIAFSHGKNVNIDPYQGGTIVAELGAPVIEEAPPKQKPEEAAITPSQKPETTNNTETTPATTNGAPPEDETSEPEEAEPEEEEEPESIIEDVFEEPQPPKPGDKTVAGPMKVDVDAVIYVDYQFTDSSDTFKIKYHINLGGTANLSTAVIRGNAEVATEVTGYLAKWPQGQCVLNVNIAKVPYEIQYKQSGEDEADINIQFKKEITETWQSTCTFIGGVTKPLKTQGPPEKWIGEALKKASPPINSIVAPIEQNEASSTTFEIPEYSVVEENLGSAKVKGTGIVSIQPATKGKDKEKGDSASLRFTPPKPPQNKPHATAQRVSH